MERRERTHPRLKEYDYSQNGCYFVTICVKNKAHLLGDISVGRLALKPPAVALSEYGKVTAKYVERINQVYEGVCVDHYVIMPNHVHLLLRFHSGDSGGLKASRPTLFTVVRSLKRMVGREIGCSIWQDSYYEHVVRNEEDYLAIWQYIENNPIKWLQE